MRSVTIFDVKRFAVHDGPGIRTTVFLKGCPLDCWWCHNPESRKSLPEEVIYTRKLGNRELETKKVYGKNMSSEVLMDELLKDKLFFEESGGGVTFSGGEPLNQIDGLTEILQQCKYHGIHTTIDTCGYTEWSNLENILPFTDLFLYDLKLIDAGNHQKFTGAKNDLIIQNLIKLLNRKINLELRIPLVPGVNNSFEEIRRYKDFLQQKGIADHIYSGKQLKIHLLPYHDIAASKYQKLKAENRMKGVESNNGLTINDFKNELVSAGFKVEIGG